MRRKSIGATSQAFHEPMSTGAFLEFLTRLGCRDAGLRGLLARFPELGARQSGAKTGTPPLSRDCSLSNIPQQNLGCRKSTGESGGIQAPGACGPGLQGAWGPGPQGLGPGPPGAQTSQITIFRKPPGGSLAKAWVSAETAASEVGTWRETKPGYPPPQPPPRFGAVREKGRGFSPSPPSATIQHAPQGRRICKLDPLRLPKANARNLVRSLISRNQLVN